MPKEQRGGTSSARAGTPRIAKKRGYHHPDLRQGLLGAAVHTLLREDVATLTMQRLARLTGVSAAAPYHHFEDLDALLAALATDGWNAWADRAASAVQARRTADERLLAMANAWLEFTRDMPAHFKVMLLPQLGDRVRFAEMHAASGRSLSLLFELLGEALPRHTRKSLASRAVLLWSTLHGFAVLRAGGVLDNVPGIPGADVVSAGVMRRLVESALAP